MQQADTAYVPGGDFAVFAVPYGKPVKSIRRICVKDAAYTRKEMKCIALP
jgi:hypothetical protein